MLSSTTGSGKCLRGAQWMVCFNGFSLQCFQTLSTLAQVFLNDVSAKPWFLLFASILCLFLALDFNTSTLNTEFVLCFFCHSEASVWFVHREYSVQPWHDIVPED